MVWPDTRERYAKVGWLLLGMVFALFFAYLFSRFIGTLVLTAFLYYATRPFYQRLKRVFRNATLSAVISMGIVTLPAVLSIIYAVSVAYQEASRAAQNHDTETLEPFLNPVLDIVPVESADAIVEGIRSPYQALEQGLTPDSLPTFVDTVVQSVGVMGVIIIHLFIALVLAFYLLRDGHRLKTAFVDDLALTESVAADYFRAVDKSFHKVFYGNILNSVITAIIAATVFNGLNYIAPLGLWIPYPTLLGILSGFASLIPFVGMKIVYFPLVGYLALRVWVFNAIEFAWFPIAVFFVSWVIADAIPDLFLRPYISCGSIHMGSLMLSYIIGPIFFGWYGLFLGPMILVSAVHFIRIVLPTLVGPKNKRFTDSS